MPNNSQYADNLVNGILSAASPTGDDANTFTISRENLGNLLNNMEKPKRPPSSFLIYKSENREKFREMFPDVTRAGDLAKLVAKHFAELSDNEKSVYEEKYAVLKQEYMEKMRLHKQFFPDSSTEVEKPKKKRGRPRKEKNPESDNEEKKARKKRTRKPKKHSREVPQQRDDTSDEETVVNESKPYVSDSDSDDETEFTVIQNKTNGISYSVDLKTGLYYDINAPWGKSLGTYDTVNKVFN